MLDGAQITAVHPYVTVCMLSVCKLGKRTYLINIYDIFWIETTSLWSCLVEDPSVQYVVCDENGKFICFIVFVFCYGNVVDVLLGLA